MWVKNEKLYKALDAHAVLACTTEDLEDRGAKCWNTYNYNSSMWHDLEGRSYNNGEGAFVVATREHLGGDPRGNYENRWRVWVFESFEEYREAVWEAEDACTESYTVDGEDYELTPRAFEECHTIATPDGETHDVVLEEHTEEAVIKAIRGLK